jgi:uncharacterized phage-like protein YoqJ
MEIAAVLDAVRTLDGPLEVVSDSTYVVNCFRDRWWEGWLRRGWTNSQKKPVANRDLWEPLIELVRARGAGVIRFTWVKGHSNDVMNDLVDRLAVEAAATQEARTGDSPPTALGPADSPRGRPGAADPRVPTGHKIVVGGHRPPELGGYEPDNIVARSVRRRLAEILDAKAKLHPDLVVLTGLGLGAEQLAADAARDAGLPYVAVLPYPEQESVWPPQSQSRYRQLLAGIEGEVLLSTSKPSSKQAAGQSLNRRDAWLGRHADEAVVVWDGKDDNVGRLVRSWQDHLGDDQVWIVDPHDG